MPAADVRAACAAACCALALRVRSTVVAVRTEYDTFILEAEESEVATHERDAVISDLNDWMGDFYRVAKIKFGKNNNALEALGFRVIS